jgi:hypothetical protein
MKISTKLQIHTHIVLTQDELRDVITDHIKTRIELDLPVDAEFVIDFADDDAGDLTALIDITSTAEMNESSRNQVPNAKRGPYKIKTVDPKTATSKPRTPTQSEKSETPETPEEPKTEAGVQVEAEEDDIPFDPDSPKKDVAVAVAVAVPEKVEPATPEDEAIAMAPHQTTKRIFAQTTTSAPPAVPELDLDPTVKAKSLFANLAKPTN